MSAPQRITPTLRRLLAALAAGAAVWRFGYDLSRETGIRSGTLYPLLIRLESAGLLSTRWSAPQAPGRPPRHLYRLTAEGRALAARLAGPDTRPLAAFA
jgi:DNA-binding PadR family transcriptional regulator